MILKGYKNIIWDFDGVIMKSSEIRINAFKETFNEYPKDKVSELISYHKVNDGLSRYVKIDFFFKNILKQKLDDFKRNKLLAKYTSICLKKLIDKNLLIADTITFIKNNFNNINFHIASGSDNKELNYLCQQLDISIFFISINGSPESKKDIVKRILNQNNYTKEQTCLVGDSINDYDASKENKIDFFGYNNERLKINKRGNYINNFK